MPGLLREMNSTSEYLFKPGGHSGLSLSEALASIRHIYLGFFFLDPEYNRTLSIGAIWSLAWGTRLPQLGGHLELQWGFRAPLTDMGHKRPVIRPS